MNREIRKLFNTGVVLVFTLVMFFAGMYTGSVMEQIKNEQPNSPTKLTHKMTQSLDCNNNNVSQ